MLGSHNINIFDRIKETSYTIGTGNFVLNGASNGFSSFSSVYSSGNNIFYAATDGTSYEVGSGVYLYGPSLSQIVRFPFKSTNSNNKVNFGQGLKEVFVTYPATHSVYTASGLNTSLTPQSSGLAFWLSSNIVGYDDNIIWDSANNRLGISTTSPSYAIDVGGIGAKSLIRASGIIPGSSGIIFASGINGDLGYAGGVQNTHYVANALDATTGSDEVFELSGVAKNYILLKKQNAGLVFAGPASGCTPPCSPDYPSFRPILTEDIADLDMTVLPTGISLLSKLGVNTAKLDGRITSYTNSFDPTTNGGWVGAAYTASGLYGGGISLVDTVNTNSSSHFGYSIYTTESGVNLNIKMGLKTAAPSSVLIIDTNNISGVPASTLDFYGHKLRIRNQKTPPASNAVGNSGDMCWDSNYLYVCIAPNTWKRAALSTWP